MIELLVKEITIHLSKQLNRYSIYIYSLVFYSDEDNHSAFDYNYNPREERVVREIESRAKDSIIGKNLKIFIKRLACERF